MPELSAETRKRLAEFLPEALRLALESYQNFMTATPDKSEPQQEPEAESDDKGKPKPKPRAKKATEAKEFKDHHEAGKVAIAHIELLLELAKDLKEELEHEEESLDWVQAETEVTLWKSEEKPLT